MTFWIHPDAEAELGDAAVYYAEHASGPVAEAFLAEFERVVGLLVENPARGPHGDFGFRVYHFDRFPYTLVYDVDDQAGPTSTLSLTSTGRPGTGSAGRSCGLPASAASERRARPAFARRGVCARDTVSPQRRVGGGHQQPARIQLRFALRMRHVNVDPKLLSREEEQAKLTVAHGRG